MQFEQNRPIEKLGINAGFIFSYFLFTTALFAILLLTKKLIGISYLHVMLITLLVTIFGFILKRML